MAVNYIDCLTRYSKNEANISALIDTNCLMQINKDDFMHMFFDKDHHSSITKPLKKQMTTLFLGHIRGDVNLYISDWIYREFATNSPTKIDLIPTYKKYLSRIGIKRAYESYFIDIANLIETRARVQGYNVEFEDTLSFIISNALNLNYYISEDNHPQELYNYILKYRDGDEKVRVKEINSIVNLSQKIYDIAKDEFDIESIIHDLFNPSRDLTLPIKIKELSKGFLLVAEKTNNIIFFINIINEIIEHKDLIYEDDLNTHGLYIIDEIFAKINISIPKKGEKLDKINIAKILFENESNWELPKNFDEHFKVLYEMIDEMYGILDQEGIYQDIEDYFTEKAFQFLVKVKCDCGEEMDVWIVYNGIVASDERGMGPEKIHAWTGEEDCSNCSDYCHVELSVYEYPIGMLNFADFDGSNCEILNKTEIGNIIGITPE